MKEKDKRKIEQIMSNTECKKNFKCINPKSNSDHNKNDLGLNDYVDCLEPDSGLCDSSLPFGHGNICKCPVRIYLVKRARGII